MNRTVWIFRVIAFLILLVFALLMMNLHSRLQRMQGSQAPEKTGCSNTSSALLHC